MDHKEKFAPSNEALLAIVNQNGRYMLPAGDGYSLSGAVAGRRTRRRNLHRPDISRISRQGRTR
jgi:hypothetical protein